jgi:hypothetical protein
VDSIDQALAVCPKDQDTYIIGGGEIYTLGLPYADKLDITRVHHSLRQILTFQISILKFGNFLILCLIVKTIIICMILPFKLSLENKTKNILLRDVFFTIDLRDDLLLKEYLIT